MVNTNAIVIISINNEDKADDARAILANNGYDELDNPHNNVLVFALPVPSKKAVDDVIAETSALLKENGIEGLDGIEALIMTADNVGEWKDYYDIDEDDDVVTAFVDNDSYYLLYPEKIADELSDAFIGRYDSEEEIAERLASNDERIQSLDEDIRDALDLVKYYSDTLRYDMWHSGNLWFRNRQGGHMIIRERITNGQKNGSYGFIGFFLKAKEYGLDKLPTCGGCPLWNSDDSDCEALGSTYGPDNPRHGMCLYGVNATKSAPLEDIVEAVVRHDAKAIAKQLKTYREMKSLPIVRDIEETLKAKDYDRVLDASDLVMRIAKPFNNTEKLTDEELIAKAYETLRRP